MIRKNIMWALPASTMHYLESMTEMLSDVDQVVMVFAVKASTGELDSCRLSIKAAEADMDSTLLMVGAALGAHYSNYAYDLDAELKEDLFEKAIEPEVELFEQPVTEDPIIIKETAPVVEPVIIEPVAPPKPVKAVKAKKVAKVKKVVEKVVEKPKPVKKEFANPEPVKQEAIKPVKQTEEQAADLAEKKSKIVSKDITTPVASPVEVLQMSEKEAKKGNKLDTPRKRSLRTILFNFMKF